MSDAFLGEVRIFAGSFAPEGWLLCQGQQLLIHQHTSLFSLLETTYGGDGSSTFALPNLTGRAAIQQGSGEGLTTRARGAYGGETAVTLTVDQLPAHTHGIFAATSGKSGQANVPGTNVCLGSGVDGDRIYGLAAGGSQMSASGLWRAGGGGIPQHNNMDPYLVMTYMISTAGIFPSRD